MQLHQVQRKTSRATSTRVGRGGRRGKTSGRGMKGQKAHAGGGPRPEIRDLIKKLPKLRGHGVNRSRTVNPSTRKPIGVNLAALDAAFEGGAEVNPQALVAAGLIRRRGGRTPDVKILGNGSLSKKLSVSGCALSASAKAAIEKAGGAVLEK